VVQGQTNARPNVELIRFPDHHEQTKTTSENNDICNTVARNGAIGRVRGELFIDVDACSGRCAQHSLDHQDSLKKIADYLVIFNNLLNIPIRLSDVGGARAPAVCCPYSPNSDSPAP
jgi:hypothetical protein